jgi:hypothetical protein
MYVRKPTLSSPSLFLPSGSHLSNDTATNSDFAYLASHSWMISEYWIEKNVEGRDLVPFQVVILDRLIKTAKNFIQDRPSR